MAATSSRNQSTSSRAPSTARPAAPARKSKQWLTVEEICEDLGIHRRTWQHWRTRRRVPKLHQLPNGEYRIHRDAYQDWLAGLEVNA
ncbi:helix-turn-helix transcriptional regulator [Nonomuraea jabiensis]|uniref:helix-turn-helix transcriptional regulator n=1 Tax=Nonomuraea jabiensis TaxID=882448 RepID=UPI003D75904E